MPSYENQPNASHRKPKVALLQKRQSESKEKRSKAGSKRIVASSAAPPTTTEPTINDMSPVYPIDAKTAESKGIPMLVLDKKSGQIIDTLTGQAYLLKPTQPASYY